MNPKNALYIFGGILLARRAESYILAASSSSCAPVSSRGVGEAGCRAFHAATFGEKSRGSIKIWPPKPCTRQPVDAEGDPLLGCESTEQAQVHHA